ncbi:MAG TPA: c-type cytochrome, partial [Alphaproteobacteria bacterium]|nr:c-type cytochrome [Alphaproteobacteria bacterium]
MNRTIIHTAVAILVVCGLAIKAPRVYAQGAAPAKAAPAATGDEGKTAEQVYKNIQALKGTPAGQVQTAMQFISNSLGVRCDFCHDVQAFEKDDKKPKQTARKMIEMQMAINRDNFKGGHEVTCFSCHRGAHDPVGVPIIAEEEPKQPGPPKQDAAAPALPTADQIIDKYIQAVGGAEAVDKVTSRVQKGTISIQGQQFPLDTVSKAPDKRISTFHTPRGDSITAIDGRAGWLGGPGGTRDMDPPEVETFSFDAALHLPTELKKMFAQFRVRPADQIGGHDVVQVIAANPGKPLTRLFFDKESGLLVRTVRYADSPLGQNPTQVDYSDYRAQDGVKIPFQWVVARPAGRFTVQMSDVQQNVPVDDAKFA